jgi:alkanesulfonate monooxygenase SsuD/methylene tetrahydromethanopterin reductase-like flavin-dependent oxidoreductase (luciferase family)
VEGRFLRADGVAELRSAAITAEASGADALVLHEGPLGDPIVLAAGLSTVVAHALLGVRVSLSAETRHPAVLARDLTSLDHVCGGRSMLCVRPPFDDSTIEAVALCRAMWRNGTAVTSGPRYPVPGAVNRPQPPGDESPQVALDLTGPGPAAPTGLRALADYLLLPTADDDVCRVERP